MDNQQKCASYWDLLPDEVKELCYEINHKRAMGEVLEEMKEEIFWVQEGIAPWIYTLNAECFRPFNSKPSGSRTIGCDYGDYYEYYGCFDNDSDTEEDEEENTV